MIVIMLEVNTLAVSLASFSPLRHEPPTDSGAVPMGLCSLLLPLL